MLLISLPAYVAPLVIVLIVLILGLTLVRPRAVHLEPYDDTEDRINRWTSKVRRQAKVRGWFR